MYFSARLVAHFLKNGQVSLVCEMQTDTGPAMKRAFL
jgi:hypothetical protein